MLQTERQKAIARLARAERGRRNQQEFLLGLSCAVGHTVCANQLLGLDATDQVKASLSSGYAMTVARQKTGSQMFFSEPDRVAALKFVKPMAKSLADQQVVLWLNQSENCGAVLLTARDALDTCETIRAFDGDTVSVLSENHNEGFILDKNQGDTVETFEIVIWGLSWLSVAQSHGFGALGRTRFNHTAQLGRKV